MLFIPEICDETVHDEKATEERQKIHFSDPFNCDECGRLFRYQKTLKEHVKRKHSNVFLHCDHCDFKSGTRFIIQRHILTQHFPTEEKSKKKPKKKYMDPAQKYAKKGNIPKFKCPECNKLFTLKSNLTRHKTFHHEDGDRMKNRSRLVCALCSRSFRDKCYLRYHLKTCETRLHRNTSPGKEQVYSCLAVGSEGARCEAIFNNQRAIDEHYRDVHAIQYDYKSLEFESRQAFNDWRINLQQNAACQFSVSRVWRRSTFYNQRMQCHRTGRRPTEKENRLRFQKLSGSKKLNGYCPAEIYVKENIDDKTCHVTIQKTHVGHSNNSNEELKILRRNKKGENDIVSKILQYVPLSTNLLNYQTLAAAGQELEQKIIINYDDIANIATSLESDTGQELEQKIIINYDNIANIATSLELNIQFTDDSTSILSFIDEHKESIPFYKAENSDDTEFGVLKKEDFVLVFMSKFQEGLLRKFGNNVITHNVTCKTNPGDLLLHSIMVLNDDWEDIAVAFLLSNRNDATVLELFLHSIKNRVGALTPQSVMTDMQMPFHSAFEVVMGAPLFSLWCIRRIYERWRQNQRKINNSAKRRNVLIRLYKLSQIEDVQVFQVKLAELINDTDPDLQSFIQYFKEEYASNSTYWASCYRIDAKVYTHTIDESFHNFLRGKIVGERNIESLRCIETYISSIEEKCCQMEYLYPQRMQKIQALRTRHHKAVRNEGLDTIHPVSLEHGEGCSHTWLISSVEKKYNASSRRKKTMKAGDEELCKDSVNSDEEEDCKGDKNLQEDNSLQLYIVQRHIKREKSKSVACTMCNVSLEEYSCTCIDYSIKCNLCKHIHAVAIYCKKNDCMCRCKPIINNDICHIELVSASDMNDGENDLRLMEGEHDYNKSIENLQNELCHKVKGIDDEEMLRNVLQYIHSQDQPAPSKEKCKQQEKPQKRYFS